MTTSQTFVPSPATAPSRPTHTATDPATGPPVVVVAGKAAEHARLHVERLSRESVGAAFEHPVPARINVLCNVCEAILHSVPANAHEHFCAKCALTLHFVGDVLTASPY